MSIDTRKFGLTRSGLVAFTLTCSILPGVSRAGEELLGARSFIEKAKASMGEQPVEAEEVSPAQAKREAFAKEVAAFHDGRSDLTPAAAVEQWLVLVDGFAALPKDRGMGYDTYYGGDPFGGLDTEIDADAVSLPLIISLVPGPECWDLLDKAIGERSGSTDQARKYDAALRILMDLVQGRLAGVDKHVEAMQASLAQSSGDMYGGRGADYVAQRMVSLTDAIRRTVGFGSREEVVRDFRELLAKPAEQTGLPRRVQVPDLCRLTSEDEARELLKMTVLTEGLVPEVRSGGRTLELLKEILVEEMAQTKTPMWGLVTSLADLTLFEALDRQYPAAEKKQAPASGSLFMRNRSYGGYDRSGQERKAAESVYLVCLIAAGRIDEAVAIAKAGKGGRELGYYQVSRITRGLPQKEFSAHMFQFLETMLADEAASHWWEYFARVALMAQQSEGALARVSKALESESLEVRRRINLLAQKVALDLGVGNLDAGVASLLQLSGIDLEELGQQDHSLRYKVIGAAQQLIRIGKLLKRPELVDQGLERVAALSKAMSQQEYYGDSWYPIAQSVQLLMETERYGEAEQEILESIKKMLQLRAVGMATSDDLASMGGQISIDLSEPLKALVGIYAELGRTDDVWYLLQEVPWWNTATLPVDDETVVVAAAKALASLDREEDAVKLLKGFILQGQVSDSAYEMLVELGPADLLTWLDKLYARDRFEERPLIWKAVILKDAGKLDEAEAVIRQALKVDPTDGETEAGQRVIAYGILADIIEAKGKPEDAAFFRSVVRSVRTAEDGDMFSEAGLTSKSLELYEQAEMDFVDAYCVQWRLAERLYALGRYEEAEKHYEIAFKRMPEQFGRVASFCFGCNGVFEKEHSRSVAERILTHLLEEHPDNPQIHFLMGQLRQAQDEDFKAYDHFRRAVEIDPQYLDAWEKLYSLSQSLFLPKAESDGMAVRALALDPMRRHFGSELDVLSEIKSMWSVLADNQRLAIDAVAVEIELKASKAALEEMKAKMGAAAQDRRRQQNRYREYGQQGNNPPLPGETLARHQVVQQLMSLLMQ